MRVLHLTTHLNIGGISNYILSLSKALKRRGVKSLVASGGGELEGEFKKYGIETKSLNIKTKSEFSPKVLASIFKVSKMIKDYDVDIVHAHTRVSQVSGFFASRMTRVPYVTTCHGFFKRRLGRRLFDFWGDKVIAISQPVRDSLIRDFNIEANRIAVVYNGVDPEKFSKDYPDDYKSELKRRLGIKNGLVVGTIGRLSPVKGHRFFIEAIKDAVSKTKDIQGIIIGDGPEEDTLKRLVKDLKIENNLRFMSSVTDTNEYLSIMDIFVFPSIKEGLGLSLLEAMAKGLPCIASNVGGISDVVTNDKTGILFNVGNVKSLSDSIIRLSGDSELRRRLGQAGRGVVKDKFSLDIMADKVLGLYNKVLDLHAAK